MRFLLFAACFCSLAIASFACLFDAPIDPPVAATVLAHRTETELALPRFPAEEVSSWSRHLASGGALQIESEDAATQPTLAGPSAEERERREAEEALVIESLGPLNAADKALMYETLLQQLERTRAEISRLCADPSPPDSKRELDLLNRRGDELLMGATLELLDANEYWVFPDGSTASAYLGSLVGHYATWPTQKDGVMVQIVFPYPKERFPFLGESKEARRDAERVATRDLLHEFNALPEERRKFFRDVLANPVLLVHEHAAEEPFIRRYELPDLRFDPQTLSMSIR